MIVELINSSFMKLDSNWKRVHHTYNMLQITEDKAYTACASRAFASRLARENTLGIGALIRRSRDIWFNELSAFDWLEAFRGHPPLGGTSAGSPHTSSSQLSASEQATAVATMTADTARELADYNAKYEARFGHVFLIFAAGRTSDEILDEIRRRYDGGLI